MASPSVTYTFSNSTVADATQVNQNFTDIINSLTDGTKDLSISALTCAGNVALNGTTTIGNASSDDLNVNGSLASSVPIKTTNSFDIGSTTKGLQRIYFGSSAGSNTTRLAGAAVTSDAQITLPSITGTLALEFGVRTETDNYTAVLTDGVILMNISAAKTVTLPAASTASRKIYIIKKVDSTGFAVTIDGNGSETIDGRTTITLDTPGESATIYCDGSNWRVLDRHFPKIRVDGGVIGITGTSSNPTKGSSKTIDVAYWTRDGGEMLIWFEYEQTAGTAGATGTGQYLFAIPTSYTIDTAKVSEYTGTANGQNTNVQGIAYAGNASNALNGSVSVYNSTKVRLLMNNTAGMEFVDDDNIALNTAARYAAAFRVPIAEWTA